MFRLNIGDYTLEKCFRPGFPQRLKATIFKTIDFNATTNHFGNTAVLWNLSNANNQRVLELIEIQKTYARPLSLDVISPVFGTAAIHLAVAKGYRDKNQGSKSLSHSNLDVLKELLNNGANVNLQMIPYGQNARKSGDHSHLEKQYHDAPQIGGNTALHIACMRRDEEFIDCLLAHQADCSIKNDLGQTPFDMLLLPQSEAKKNIAFVSGGMNNFNDIYKDDAELLLRLKLKLNHSTRQTAATNYLKLCKKYKAHLSRSLSERDGLSIEMQNNLLEEYKKKPRANQLNCSQRVNDGITKIAIINSLTDILTREEKQEPLAHKLIAFEKHLNAVNNQKILIKRRYNTGFDQFLRCCGVVAATLLGLIVFSRYTYRYSRNLLFSPKSTQGYQFVQDSQCVKLGLKL